MNFFLCSKLCADLMTSKEWWVTEYAEDIHRYLYAKQKCRLTYRNSSPQIAYRPVLVDWLSYTCEKMEFSKTVQHLAMYMLDIFMDNHDILIDYLKLVALCCLIIAVKLEENDNAFPVFSELSVFLDSHHRLTEYVQMEVSILRFFNWNLLVPTVAHFVEYYALHAICSSDYHAGQPLRSVKQAKNYLRGYLDYFLEVCLHEVTILQYEPSLVAAAIILLSRKSLFLTPVWPKSMQAITYYKHKQLLQCSDILQRILDEDNRASAREAEREDSSEIQEIESDCSSCRSSGESSVFCSPCNSE